MSTASTTHDSDEQDSEITLTSNQTRKLLTVLQHCAKADSKHSAVFYAEDDRQEIEQIHDQIRQQVDR